MVVSVADEAVEGDGDLAEEVESRTVACLNEAGEGLKEALLPGIVPASGLDLLGGGSCKRFPVRFSQRGGRIGVSLDGIGASGFWG